jgi:hypothetical protein
MVSERYQQASIAAISDRLFSRPRCGRAKISVFGAHVGFLGELTLTLGFGRRIVNELLPRNGFAERE